MVNVLTTPFIPPGPVAAAFMKSNAMVRAIMGPIGSGKTSVALVEGVRRAGMLAPSPLDGIRRAKYLVVRDTYRQLAKTTIPSWWNWMPKNIGHWQGGTNEPAVHTIKFNDGKGIIELITEFVAIGENSVEDVLRGYEPTFVYLNEGDRLAPEVLAYAIGRAGRYPPKLHGGPSWYGVWVDFNAPDDDNYCYKKFVEDLPEGWAFFRQPSGFSPGAENVANLPDGYYENQAKGQDAWYIRRMIENQFGYSREGQPVYPEFNDMLHVSAQKIVADIHLPLRVGLDAGLTPAATFWQSRPNGQRVGVGELVPGSGVGPGRFGRMLKQRLADDFPGFTISGVADPSAEYGVDKEDGEQTWIDRVAAETGIPIRSAKTNELSARLEAVKGPLERMIDGRHPGLLICRSMKILIKGFMSGYRFKKIAGPNGRFEDKPEKNEFSHPHDTAQYALLEDEWSFVLGRTAFQKRSAQPQAQQQMVAQTDFAVFG